MGSARVQSRGVGTGETGCCAGACAPSRTNPAAVPSAAPRNVRRSICMTIDSLLASGDLEVALHGTLGPRAGDEALVRADVFHLAVDDVVNGVARGILAVGFEVNAPVR